MLEHALYTSEEHHEPVRRQWRRAGPHPAFVWSGQLAIELIAAADWRSRCRTEGGGCPS
jgi:hypothetical protein